MIGNTLAMEPDLKAETARLDQSTTATATPAKPNPQTGPLTEAGKEASKRNSVRHGLTGAGVVLPEALRRSVDRLRDEFAKTYAPVDEEDWRLVGLAALGFGRFQAAIDEQTYAIAERSEQALSSWDEAEASAAEKLANRLSARPSWVRSRLLTSLAGCRWLVQQWRVLAAALEHSGTWDETRQATALHLQGLATIDHEADRSAVRLGTIDDRRALVRLEINRLEARIGGDLAEADARRRDRAIDGQGYLNEPGFLRLVRYEAAALRMYEQAIEQLKARRQARAETEAEAERPRPPAPIAIATVNPAPSITIPAKPPMPPPELANWSIESVNRRIDEISNIVTDQFPNAMAILKAIRNRNGEDDDDDDTDLDDDHDHDNAPTIAAESLETVATTDRPESRRARKARLKRERAAQKRGRIG